MSLWKLQWPPRSRGPSPWICQGGFRYSDPGLQGLRVFGRLFRDPHHWLEDPLYLYVTGTQVNPPPLNSEMVRSSPTIHWFS